MIIYYFDKKNRKIFINFNFTKKFNARFVKILWKIYTS